MKREDAVRDALIKACQALWPHATGQLKQAIRKRIDDRLSDRPAGKLVQNCARNLG